MEQWIEDALMNLKYDIIFYWLNENEKNLDENLIIKETN